MRYFEIVELLDFRNTILIEGLCLVADFRIKEFCILESLCETMCSMCLCGNRMFEVISGFKIGRMQHI